MHNVKSTDNDAAVIRGKHDAKSELRKCLRSLRASIPTGEKKGADAAICERLLKTRAYRESNVILTYLSVKDEIDTRGIIECAMASGKHVALPRCIPGTRKMSWHLVKGLDGLVVNAFGIEEPDDDDETLIDPAALPRSIAIVPALAFDEAGFRIGYGGGFYDVFLDRVYKGGVCYCRLELDRYEYFRRYPLRVERRHSILCRRPV